MANTFKFGNKNWAVKKDYVLAYNDENNNFKPLPFDFTRDSIATYVDSDGLIKTAQKGIARIDYTDNTDGHLLLEPARTNLVTYSEDFSEWTDDRVTVSVNQITSPDGVQNADLIAENSENSIHRIYIGSISLTDNIDYTITVFAKKGTSSVIQLTPTASAAIGSGRANFDLENGVLGTVSGGSASIENFGNGWYRCSYTFEALATTTSAIAVNLVNDNTTATRNVTYTGSTNSNVYLWGAQIETGSYATSYIPTEGETKTRVNEVVSDMTDLQTKSLLASDEGTWFVHLKDMFFEITGTGVGSMVLYLDSGNQIEFLPKTNTSFKISLDNSIALDDISGENKIAISYDSSGLVIYKNGVSEYSTSSSIYSAAFEQLHLSESTRPHKININNMRLYNTRLSNSELETLTTL